MRIRINGHEFEVSSYEEVEAYAAQQMADPKSALYGLKRENVLLGVFQAYYKVLVEKVMNCDPEHVKAVRIADKW